MTAIFRIAARTFARTTGRRALAPTLLAVLFAGLPAVSQTAPAPKPLSGEGLPVPGRPVPADHGRLSEHNIEWLQTQPPQAQMEFLLGAAVNHDRGATNLIADMVGDWRGKLHRTPRWESLQDTALYSNDLRVRAAAIEINLAVVNLAKTDEAADRLIESAKKYPNNRPYAAWELGMLANRGIEAGRIHELLAEWIHDSNQQTRFWSVEGLAHVGTDDTIKNFLDVFRNEPSLEVRERAGCSLAKSGMLTREQRLKAVPGLIELGDDPSLDATTRNWVYQALREITNVSLPNDPATWRNWYATHGAEKAREFGTGDSWSVLGNS
jgi:hypothetical protein